MEEKLICSHCGNEITDDDYSMVNGQIVCSDCVERYCCTCDRCGATIFDSDAFGDEYTNLCQSCHDNFYIRCEICDALVHIDDCFHLNGYDYCSDCYHDEVDKCRNIHDYSYKPEPIFYGDSSRYFGVELEIDGAGKDDDNAEKLLRIANSDDNSERLYIKGDGSLDDGLELISHPCPFVGQTQKNLLREKIGKNGILEYISLHHSESAFHTSSIYFLYFSI